VQLARDAGAIVEGELGPLCGPVKGVVNADMVKIAGQFVEETRVDLLALSIPKDVVKDVSPLRELAESLPIPVAIHGAGKLGPDGSAIVHQLGALKINFHTGVKRAMLQGLKQSVCKDVSPLSSLTGAYDAVTLFVRRQLNGNTAA
jgi:fructose/tagatose bisphosphate aldolase